MKLKQRLSGLLILLSAVFLLALGQNWLSQVSAKVSAYLVRFPDHLDFGVVFPEENLLKNYEISFTGDTSTDIDYDYTVDKTVGSEYEETITITQGNSIKYQIYEDRKELPDGYDGEGDPAMIGYYRNLCPHLDSESEGGEGDSVSSSFLSYDDTSDTWLLNFTVPPIEGYVPQDEPNILTVPVADDYGCDLTLDELPQATTLTVDLDEDCLSFVSDSADPTESSHDEVNEVLTWNFGDIYYGDSPEVKFKVKAIAACPNAVTTVAYDDGFKTTDDSGTETLSDVPGEVIAAAAEIKEPLILGIATGANLLPSILGSLAALSTGLYLRRRSTKEDYS